MSKLARDSTKNEALKLSLLYLFIYVLSDLECVVWCTSLRVT